MDSPYFWQNLKWVFHLPDVVWTPNLPSCLQDFFTARAFSLLYRGQSQPFPHPEPLCFPRKLKKNPWGLTMYIFYKMSCFPLSVHILQKLYPFLMLPLLCEEKSHSPTQRKVAEGWFSTLLLHPRWALDSSSETCSGTVLRIAGRKGLTSGNPLPLHLEI